MILKFHRFLSALVMCALLVTIGCSSAQKPNKSDYTNAAEYAYAFAEFQFEKKDWDYARSLFEKVQHDYPYSLYAAKAELRAADTYFREKMYIRAAAAYRRFIQLHPMHDDVDYSAYRIVRSYTELMPNGAFFMPPTWERDRRDSTNAYQAAQQFLRSYSDSEYADEVRGLLQNAADRLANHELYVAQYYMHRRHSSPIATIRRTNVLIEKYPESTLVPEALALQVDAAIALDDLAQAESALEQLRANFPESAYLSAAEQSLGAYVSPAAPAVVEDSGT